MLKLQSVCDLEGEMRRIEFFRQHIFVCKIDVLQLLGNAFLMKIDNVNNGNHLIYFTER